MPKPLVQNSPYPSYKDFTRDSVSARIISSAYATSCGELNSILQYVYQTFAFNHAGEKETSDIIKSIAMAEMMHLDMLGNSLINLGSQPIFTFQPPVAFNFYSSKFVSYSGGFAEMLENDIVAERHAINSYKKMLSRLKNKGVRDLIARLKEDEELHLETFKSLRLRYVTKD